MDENTKILKEIAEKMFDLMSVGASVSVDFNKEDKVYIVNVKADDATGLLIGKRGETLLSIQNILSVLFKQKIGEWQNVVVNIGDYREKEEEYLKGIAEGAVQRALETGNPQNLYNLKAWQRRIIHLYLADNKEVETVSEGEGEDRYLVISSKK